MKYITPQLETERLILKRGTYDDYVKVYEYDFTKLRNINGEFEFVKFDSEQLKGWENSADEEPYTLDFILFIKNGMIPIGNLVYDRYDEENNSLEISINIHPNYWGKGYAKEAVLKSMDYVYSSLDIDNIIYSYGEGNTRSKSLNDKIGFKSYKSRIEHYKRIDKDIVEYINIMSKENFYELYPKLTK